MLSICQYESSDDEKLEKEPSSDCRRRSDKSTDGVEFVVKKLRSNDDIGPDVKHVPLILLPPPLRRKGEKGHQGKQPRQSAAAVKRPPRSGPRNRLCVSENLPEDDDDLSSGKEEEFEQHHQPLSNDDFKLLLVKPPAGAEKLSTSTAMIGYDCYHRHTHIAHANSIAVGTEQRAQSMRVWDDGIHKHFGTYVKTSSNRREPGVEQQPVTIQPYKSKRIRRDCPSGRTVCDIPLTEDGTGTHDVFKTHHPAITIAMYDRGKHKISTLPSRKLNSVLISTNSPVNKLKWCPVQPLSHLMATASMDGVIRIVNAIDGDTILRQYRHHTAAVKDINWSSDGNTVLSCGFDKTARLISVETGQEKSSLKHSAFLTCCRFHPCDENLFIVGASNSHILGSDVRTGEICRTYTSKGQFGQVLDTEFISGGSTFISSSDIVARDCSSKTLIAWDFSTTAVLSNQIYQENYTCPSVKCHPDGRFFLAQSNGNYIAVFSTQRPYRLNKYKRYDSHCVMSYGVGLDTSPDGQFVVSGSSDGQMYIYDYGTSRLMKSFHTNREICLSVMWHPLLSDVIATSSWNGYVDVWAGRHS